MDQNQKLDKIIQKEKPQYWDIFSGIIYYIPKEKSLGTPSKVHRVLYKLKQEYDSKSNLLDCFTFSTDGIIPISNEVGNFLYSLRLSNVIYTDGNGGFIKNKDANKCLEECVLPLFNKKELKQLEMMATDYIKILKVTKDYIEIAK